MIEGRLLALFVRQDIAQRYTGSVIGVAWAAIGPLLQLGLFALVFGQIFKARVPGLQGGEYISFLALGTWPWFAFAEALGRSTTALSDQGALLKKVAISPLVLVAARVISPFLVHLVGFGLVLAALAATGMTLQWQSLGISLLGWLPFFLLALAMAPMLALTQVFIRDLTQITVYALPAWMFLSPILYPRSMAPEWMQSWFVLNPITAWVEWVRDPILFGRFSLDALPTALIVTGLLALSAAGVYRRLQPYLEDFL